jgi:MFS family permease
VTDVFFGDGTVGPGVSSERDTALVARMAATLAVVGLANALFAGLVVALVAPWVGPVVRSAGAAAGVPRAVAGYWWVPAVLALLAGCSWAQLRYVRRQTLAAVDADRVTAEDRPDLHRRVTRLANQAGATKPAVYVAPSSAPNSFALDGGGDPALVVSEGLLERLDGEELDAVLAHELAHLSNRDATVMTLASFLPALTGDRYSLTASLGSPAPRLLAVAGLAALYVLGAAATGRHPASPAYAARFVVGLGVAAVVGGVGAASQYGTVSLLPVFAVAAWGVSPAYAAGVLAAAIAWQAGLGFLVPLLLLVALGLRVALPAGTPTETGVDTLSFGHVGHVVGELRRSNMAFVAFILFLYILVWQSFTGFYPTYLVEEKGLSSSIAGVLFSVFFAFGVVVKPVAGAAYDRIGMRSSLVLVLVGPVAGFVLLPFVDGFWPLAAITALVSTMLGSGAITQSFLSDSIPAEIRGTGLGVVRTTAATLGAAGPVLFGAVADRGYFDEGYVLLGVIVVAVILLTLRLPKTPPAS